MGSASLLVPGSLDVPMEQGRYTFRIAGDADEVHVWVVTREGQPARSAAIDLVLHFVEGAGLTASNYAEPFQPVFQAVRDVLGQAGIKLGDIQVFDQTGDEAKPFVDLDMNLDASSPLRRLLTYSTRGSAFAYHLFFVRQIHSPDDTDIPPAPGEPPLRVLGASPGIPGAIAIPGTRSSGTVLALDPFLLDGRFRTEGPRTAPVLGRGMVHEMLHEMGLFHTTEAYGGLHDIIADTPECPEIKGANGDPVQLLHDQCVNYDGDNIMFWSLRGNLGRLSPGQAAILGRSPLVYATE
jgi:hypothetical protein